MISLDDTLLLSGNDIPFFAAKVNVRQPLIKEIAFIGEENFFMGCNLLNFSKDMLGEEDKNSLADIDDFDILMSIVNGEDAIEQKLVVSNVLNLLFPNYDIEITKEGIHLKNDVEETIIDSGNFPEFKQIIVKVFDLGKKMSDKDAYNPKSDAAKRIAEKLKKGREKAAMARGETKKISVFSRYISILAVGLGMDINDLFNYTVYQLFDKFDRYQKFQNFDINLRARMAGATDLEEVDNWMEDIH